MDDPRGEVARLQDVREGEERSAGGFDGEMAVCTEIFAGEIWAEGKSQRRARLRRWRAVKREVRVKMYARKPATEAREVKDMGERPVPVMWTSLFSSLSERKRGWRGYGVSPADLTVEVKDGLT